MIQVSKLRHYHAIRQCRSFDQFEDQRLHAVGFFEAVNLRDVRMVQRGEDLGFALEASQPIRIAGERLRQDLQGDSVPTASGRILSGLVS